MAFVIVKLALGGRGHRRYNGLRIGSHVSNDTMVRKLLGEYQKVWPVLNGLPTAVVPDAPLLVNVQGVLESGSG